MTALTYLEHVRTRRFLAKEAQQAVREARLDNYAIRSANAPGGGSGRTGGSDLSDLYIRLEEKELNAAKLLLELQNEQGKDFGPTGRHGKSGAYGALHQRSGLAGYCRSCAYVATDHLPDTQGSPGQFRGAA